MNVLPIGSAEPGTYDEIQELTRLRTLPTTTQCVPEALLNSRPLGTHQPQGKQKHPLEPQLRPQGYLVHLPANQTGRRGRIVEEVLNWEVLHMCSTTAMQLNR